MSDCVQRGPAMKLFGNVAITLLLIALLTGAASSQPTIAERSEIPEGPKTKLEALIGTSGAGLTRQSTEVGSIGRGSIRVAALIVTNSTNGTETKGLLISFSDGAGTRKTAYIDYDEIPGLLSGIDYITGVDLATLKLANTEAIYRTRGNFSVAAFNSGESKRAFISMDRLSADTLPFDFADLARFRDLIRTAKGILDNPDLFEAKDNRQTPERAVQPEAVRPQSVAVPVAPPKFRLKPKVRPKAKAKPKPRSEVRVNAKAKSKAKAKTKAKAKSNPAKAQPFPKPI
jgi:hypothetical protein